jgi:hypothetical protein
MTLIEQFISRDVQDSGVPRPNLQNLPSNSSDLTLLLSAIYAELKRLPFMLFPQYRALHFDNSDLNEETVGKIGKCDKELRLGAAPLRLNLD